MEKIIIFLWSDTKNWGGGFASWSVLKMISYILYTDINIRGRCVVVFKRKMNVSGLLICVTSANAYGDDMISK